MVFQLVQSRATADLQGVLVSEKAGRSQKLRYREQRVFGNVLLNVGLRVGTTTWKTRILRCVPFGVRHIQILPSLLMTEH